MSKKLNLKRPDRYIDIRIFVMSLAEAHIKKKNSVDCLEARSSTFFYRTSDQI